jgi:hypothetical protein
MNGRRADDGDERNATPKKSFDRKRPATRVRRPTASRNELRWLRRAKNIPKNYRSFPLESL